MKKMPNFILKIIRAGGGGLLSGSSRGGGYVKLGYVFVRGVDPNSSCLDMFVSKGSGFNSCLYVREKSSKGSFVVPRSGFASHIWCVARCVLFL